MHRDNGTSGFRTDDQHSVFKDVIQRSLKDQGDEAVLLGGTDFALAINEQTAAFPLVGPKSSVLTRNRIGICYICPRSGHKWIYRLNADW